MINFHGDEFFIIFCKSYISFWIAEQKDDFALCKRSERDAWEVWVIFRDVIAFILWQICDLNNLTGCVSVFRMWCFRGGIKGEWLELSNVTLKAGNFYRIYLCNIQLEFTNYHYPEIRLETLWFVCIWVWTDIRDAEDRWTVQLYLRVYEAYD